MPTARSTSTSEPEPGPDKESNWLLAPKSRNVALALLYAPKPQVAEGTGIHRLSGWTSQQGQELRLPGETLNGKAVHIVVGGRVKYRDGSLVD